MVLLGAKYTQIWYRAINSMTFWKRKCNAFPFPLQLESGNGSVSVSRKKGFSCSEYGNGNVFPGSTFPGKTRFHFQKKTHVSVRPRLETVLRFRFQEKKNRLQYPYGLSVVNSANDDPAQTKRVKIPVAEQLRG
jgi:hypothetical protein